nr:MAG TPA: hypothetical protein [Bacteriophage sp.]
MVWYNDINRICERPTWHCWAGLFASGGRNDEQQL